MNRNKKKSFEFVIYNSIKHMQRFTSIYRILLAFYHEVDKYCNTLISINLF